MKCTLTQPTKLVRHSSSRSGFVSNHFEPSRVVLSMHGVAQIGVTSATYQVPCAAHSHSPPHTNACCSQDEDGTLTSIGSQQVAHSPCSQARVYRALADIASKHSQYARPTLLVQSPSNPFAPPEIASAAAPCTSADIWRLGATLFFLVGEVIAQDAEAA